MVSPSDADSLETVYQIQYDGSGDFDFPRALGIATFSVGDEDAWIDEGDIVLLSHTMRDFGTTDETWGTKIQAFDPADADGTIRTVFETEEFRAWDLLLDPSTDSIILPRRGLLRTPRVRCRRRLRVVCDDARGFVQSRRS